MQYFMYNGIIPLINQQNLSIYQISYQGSEIKSICSFVSYSLLLLSLKDQDMHECLYENMYRPF